MQFGMGERKNLRLDNFISTSEVLCVWVECLMLSSDTVTAVAYLKRSPVA